MKDQQANENIFMFYDKNNNEIRVGDILRYQETDDDSEGYGKSLDEAAKADGGAGVIEVEINGAKVPELVTASCSAYIPKVGDTIYARRIRRSKIYHNMVIGPVVDTWDNACRVITNPGTEIEGDFRLHYNEWHIRPLFIEEFPPSNVEPTRGADDT